jgi:MinD-like ATPase involved in chromosome partitioning or flagellar assembly
MQILDKKKIITFYSYKGGVGRTMALANIAFLAAASGKKILVMDWDLEAPGLLQYFRGLIDASEYKKVREKKGVLDLLWDWSDRIRSLKNKTDVDKLVVLLKDSLFAPLVSKLSDDANVLRGGKLDYIGSGSNSVKIGNAVVSYEAALDTFGWSKFSSEEFAPLLLQGFKDWATKNYDYVLIDSRTGLADVAGICTMQLPDKVALFFVLNRQNFEGISKVANAIRRHSDDKIPIRAIVTRTYEVNSDDQSEAKANAIDQLIKVGGFSPESANHDVNTLEIFHSLGLPYQESLSIFTTARGDPKTDTLTLRYLSLANKLLDLDLPMPNLSTSYVEQVKQRLRPKKVTLQYLDALRDAEPTRGMVEVIRYLEGAIEAEGPDQIAFTSQYLRAILQTSVKITQNQEEPENQYLILEKAIELLRIKYRQESEQWRQDLINSLDGALNLVQIKYGLEEAISILEEIDAILSDSSLNINLKIKRLKFKLKAAELIAQQKDKWNQVKNDIGQIRSLVQMVVEQHQLAKDQLQDIRLTEAESFLLLGSIYQREGDVKTCVAQYQEARFMLTGILANITNIDNSTRNDAERLTFEVNYKLAVINDGTVSAIERVERAVDAAKLGANLSYAAVHFSTLLDVLLDNKSQHQDKILEFCRAYFLNQDQGQKLILVSAVTRSYETAEKFLKQFKMVLEVIIESKSAIDLLGNVEKTLLIFESYFRRRFANTLNKIEYKKISNQFDEVMKILNPTELK